MNIEFLNWKKKGFTTGKRSGRWPEKAKGREKFRRIAKLNVR